MHIITIRICFFVVVCVSFPNWIHFQNFIIIYFWTADPIAIISIRHHIEGFWRVAVVQSHSHNYENCGLGKRLVKRELEKMPKVEKRKEVATRKLCRYTMLDIIRGVKKCGCSRWNGPLKTVNIYANWSIYVFYNT